ncbi:MAG: RimK family alpha-L-glutamate ligase [Hespellia sp.]|jgi:RimK family alpha-L-glutamate ligase|nr:RimK family alpha-L-glutamate ligase [Hespellia sp.]
MHYGWLVVNGYITNPKFLEIYQWIREAGDRQGCQIDKKTNIELMEHFCRSDFLEMRQPDFVIFWDKDVRLALLMEAYGFRLFNSAKSIAMCDDKSLSFIGLKNAGVRMPRTWIAPKTFAADGYDKTAFFIEAAEELGYPLIVKECFGSFGQQVYLVANRSDLLEIVGRLKNRPFLLQEYIEHSRGRDIRIHIVGGQAVACMERHNPNDFRANITNGGSMRAYEPNESQVTMARAACDALGLDFAGVDILFGENGEPVLCEVNSNAHFKNIYDCTGINVADAIISYIKKTI